MARTLAVAGIKIIPPPTGITTPAPDGSHGGKYLIRFTDNFFSDNWSSSNGYQEVDYGNDIMEWLALSSHEVNHIQDIKEIHGGTMKYITTFVKDYIKSGSHDDTPREARAEHGAVNFRSFKNFTDKTYGKGSLERLFRSIQPDSEKIKTLDLWFKASSEADEKRIFPPLK